MFALYKKELQHYLNGISGYLYLLFFSTLAVFLFIKDIFIVNSASMQPFFSLLPWLLIIFVPIFCAGLLSLEKKQNTLELLLSLPLKESSIIISKFLAATTFLLLSLLFTISLPLSLYIAARIYLPQVIVGYLGALFLGMTFISVSIYFSSLFESQVLSFLSSFILLFFSLFLGTDFFTSIFPKQVQDLLIVLSPLYHYQNWTRGVIELRSVLYFLSVIIAFLFLSIVELEKRE